MTIDVINEDDEDDEDDERDENADQENSYNSDQKKKKENILIRCLLSTSMLLVNGELGAWVPSHISMPIAAELASAAAGVEQARSWIVSCTSGSDDTIWKCLLLCDDQDVQSWKI